jgi:hypothetical protein
MAGLTRIRYYPSMSTSLLRAVFAIVAAATVTIGIGCGGPAGPTTVTTSALRILGDPVLTLTTDERRRVSVQEVDANGHLIVRDPDSYSWTSSDPGVVRVESGGVLHAGQTYGPAVLSVRSPAGPTASARVWIQLPPGAASGYRITLQFAADVPPAWRDELAAAASVWQQHIRGDLPAVAIAGLSQVCGTPPGEPEPPALAGIERGTLIYVGQSGRFGAGPQEAVGGPCLQRPLPRPTTIYGRITLNRAQPVDGIDSGHLQWLALHEMGHVLGLVAIVQGVQPDWFNAATGTYTGAFGLEGYRRFNGTAVPALQITGGHWPFRGDVMSGVGTVQITPATVGALMDSGYPAFW